MPRKKLIYSAYCPYHITSRSNNREWFYVKPEVAWNIFNFQLFVTSIIYGLEIHAFVLMSNHFHLLVTTPHRNIGEAMKYFLRETSREINAVSQRTNHIFGGRYHWSLISEPLYFANATKYVYRNPVAVGACEKTEDYPFSTLQGLIGKTRLHVALKEPHPYFRSILKTDYETMIEWFNRDVRPEHQAAMSAALRRTEFQLPVCKTSKRKSDLETELY